MERDRSGRIQCDTGMEIGEMIRFRVPGIVQREIPPFHRDIVWCRGQEDPPCVRIRDRVQIQSTGHDHILPGIRGRWTVVTEAWIHSTAGRFLLEEEEGVRTQMETLIDGIEEREREGKSESFSALPTRREIICASECLQMDWCWIVWTGWRWPGLSCPKRFPV